MLSTVSLLALASTVTADWSNNLNFRSPSHDHPALGISMPKLMKRQTGTSYTDANTLNFTHGVASGDPYPESVILWTRVAPMQDNDRSNVTVNGTVPLYNHDTEPYVKMSTNPVCVEYALSESEDFSDAACSGRAYTASDIDYTVKIEASGLKPFTRYYYQFTVCDSNVKSPLGRTKTAPAVDDDSVNVGVGVFSCSNFAFGFFNPYGNAARKDNIDYVIHLGDYIYEYATGSEARPVQPEREIFTLYDYRRRLATYRTDLDLLLSHATFPWIPVWDDHEIANNGYRDGFSSMNNTEESFEESGMVSVDQRKMNAVRAYFEWMPIRQVNMEDNLRIWRSFSIGKLFDLAMLDTRYYDRSITTLGDNTDYITDLLGHAARTLMGSLQENWFYRTLINSAERGATWRLIGSQVVFSRINTTSWFGTAENPYNGDAWDGYMANKARTLQTLYDHNIGNNIFLAGDTHLNWATDLVWLGEESYDQITGAGALGAEFAGTAVSSPSSFGADSTILECNEQSQALIDDNVELQWQEGYYRGYYELQISAEKVEAQYFGAPSLVTRNGFEVSLANFTVLEGGNRLERPVAGGRVESGALQRGDVVMTNLTRDTNTGEWFHHDFPRVNIDVSW